MREEVSRRRVLLCWAKGWLTEKALKRTKVLVWVTTSDWLTAMVWVST
jgi:hypothetical protein